MTDTYNAGDLVEVRPSTRKRLLDVATQLFATNGYEHTSTLSIARAARTSETQLMKKFINKQGLLEDVFAELLTNIECFLQDAQQLSSPREQLRGFFRRTLQWLYDNPNMKKMLVLDMRRIRAKTGDVVIPRGAPEFLRRLDDMLESARQAGQLRCGMRVQVIRSAIFGAMGELLRDSLAAEDEATSRVAPQEIMEMLDYILSCFFSTDQHPA